MTRRCRLLRAGYMVEVSPLVMECIRERQRAGEPNAPAMQAAEREAAEWLAGIGARLRSERMRAFWGEE